MKHFYTLLLLLLGLTVSYQSVAQGSLAALDAKNGFKDAKFGMSISAFKGLTLDEDEMNSEQRKYYRGPTYNNVLGNTKLKYIQYSFYKGRLDKIVFVVKGNTACYNVLKAVQVAYGPGIEGKVIDGELNWKGNLVYLRLTPMKDDGVDYYHFQMGNESYAINNMRKPEISRIAKDL